MKKLVKKTVTRRVSAIPESVRGLKLDHFTLQERSEFQVGKRIWFQFHYHNLSNDDVGYGSMGMAIHKWNGSQWQLHDYKHSYGGPKGTLRVKGGPGDGAFHDDNWKVNEVGEFALTPYIAFDSAAAHKIETLKELASVIDLSHMAQPLYVTILHNKPGMVHNSPPATLFPDQFVEVEVEEEIEVEDEDGHSVGQPGDDSESQPPSQPVSPSAPGHQEVSRQVIEWKSGSGTGEVRIDLSRRVGDQWLVHTSLNHALDADNRIEVVFLASEKGTDEES